MFWMRLICRIKMAVDLGKIALAAAPVMNMHGIKARGILHIDVGKPKHLCLYQNTAIRGPIKFYKSGKLRGLPASPHPGHSLRLRIS